MTALQAERVVRPWAWPFALPTAPRVLSHILLLSRLLALALIGAFASVAGHLDLLSFGDFQPWWLLTMVSASLFSWAQFTVPARHAAVVPLLEAVVALLIVVFAGAAGWPLVVYLVMAPVFAGIAAGGWLPALVAGGQLAALSVLWVLGRSPWQGVDPGVLFRLCLVGLLFGTATALLRQATGRTLQQKGGYAQALALLEQLSTITRQLPSGLGVDAVTAEARSTLASALGADEVALFVNRAGRWAMHGGQPRAAVLADLPGFGEGLRSGLNPLPSSMTDPANPWQHPATVRVLPLRVSGSLRAVAVARFAGRSSPTASPGGVGVLAEEVAAQIAAAEAYAEVRERATAEERRRVSREIHDGVAQDLAALTYRLDNIALDTGLEPVGEAAEEVRRLVRELRLSIFDLRTDLGTNEALGTAIGQYAQQVASTTGIVVHTTVSEHGAPLEANIQHELLRVCQEAVANARRHSRARNMWITYRNNGHGSLLRVADDGVGLIDPNGGRRLGGEGLAIMRERVGRIGGTITVRRRIGGGTVLEVSVRRCGREHGADAAPDVPAAEALPALYG